MDNKTNRLLDSAARLYRLGVELEAARTQLKELVARGVSYEDDKMKQALLDFQVLDAQWKALEQQHLALRDEIAQAGNPAKN